MASTKKKNSDFLVQGAILGSASILVRVIGLIYRVPLNNILGEKGISFYGVAYDVYSILLILSSYSMPLAVSKMVSARVSVGQYRNTKRIFLGAIVFSLSVGIIAFLITFFGADVFAKLWNYPQSALALKVLSPALIIMSVLGVLRGYFQGLGTMVPTALSNIIEQIINAIVSIVAARVLFKVAANEMNAAGFIANKAESYGAAGGTLGTVLGALAGLGFMIFLFMLYRKVLDKQIRRDKTTEQASYGTIIKVLVLTIVPVIVSTTIYNLGSLVDSGLFSNIMQRRGMDPDMIYTLNGMYTGNYRIIINVPTALASAMASSLIPSIVASVAQKSRGQIIRKVEFAIRVTMIVSLPCMVGIGVLAKPIVNFLFPSSVDPDKVALMLMIGCVSVALYSLSTITNSILQGIDKMRIPVFHSAFSLIVHIIILVISLYITNFNIFCVVVCDMIFALVICILNHRSLRKYLNYRQEISKTFIIPLICSAIMGVLAFFINNGIHTIVRSNAISVFVTIVAAAVIYVLLLMLLKAVDADELSDLPGGGKLVRLGRKLHILK